MRYSSIDMSLPWYVNERTSSMTHDQRLSLIYQRKEQRLLSGCNGIIDFIRIFQDRLPKELAVKSTHQCARK